MTLTDFHASNIFADSAWNITAMLDLELTACLPIKMSAPPYWLTSRGIDQLNGEHVLEEFLTTFEHEERLIRPPFGSITYRADIIRQSWRSNTTLYLWALCSLTGCYNVPRYYVQTQYEPDVNGAAFAGAIFPYWAVGARGILEGNLKNKALYDQHIRRFFAEVTLPSP